MLGSYYFGARNLTTTKLLVKSPGDLKGRKRRCVPHEMSLAVIIGLGGNPTPVNFAELFTALRRNRRWSGESALHHLVTEILRSTEVFMITRHQVLPEPYVINEKVWQRLSPENQAALKKATSEATALNTELLVEEERTLQDKLAEKGMTIVGPKEGLDIEAFKKSVRKEMIERFEGKDWPKGLAAKIDSLLK